MDRRSGYNLVEVIIAMGILAWVLLAIAGLFSFGTRGVYSGKTQTKAAALAQKVVEDLRNFDTRTKRYAIFGYVATDSSSTNKTYDSQTATALSDTLLQAIRTNWETQVEELPKGYIECKLYNVGGTNLSNCTFIRYDLKVHWTEGERARELTFNFAF